MSANPDQTMRLRSRDVGRVFLQICQSSVFGGRIVLVAYFDDEIVVDFRTWLLPRSPMIASATVFRLALFHATLRWLIVRIGSLFWRTLWHKDGQNVDGKIPGSKDACCRWEDQVTSGAKTCQVLF